MQQVVVHRDRASDGERLILQQFFARTGSDTKLYFLRINTDRLSTRVVKLAAIFDRNLLPSVELWTLHGSEKVEANP